MAGIYLPSWAISAILAGFALFLTVAGLLFRAAFRTIKEQLSELFETKAAAERREAELRREIERVDEKTEALGDLVETRLVGAIERIDLTLARLEERHEQRHQSTTQALVEIKDELRRR